MSSAGSSRDSSRGSSSDGTETDGSVSSSGRKGDTEGESGDESDRLGGINRDENNSGIDHASRSNVSWQESEEGGSQESEADGVVVGEGGGRHSTSRQRSAEQSQEESEADEAAATPSAGRSDGTASDDESEAIERRSSSSGTSNSSDTDGGGGETRRQQSTRSVSSQSGRKGDGSNTGQGESVRSGSRNSTRTDDDVSIGEKGTEASHQGDTGEDFNGEKRGVIIDSGSGNDNDSSDDSSSAAYSPRVNSERVQEPRRGRPENKVGLDISRHHQEATRAAMIIQRDVRKRQARAKTDGREKRQQQAATRIQARTRGHLERRKQQPQATKPTVEGHDVTADAANGDTPAYKRGTRRKHEKGESKLAGEVDDVASTGKLSNRRASTEEHGEAARANKKLKKKEGLDISRHHQEATRAAVIIQRDVRKRHARAKTDGREKRQQQAATRIQARTRGHLERRKQQPQAFKPTVEGHDLTADAANGDTPAYKRGTRRKHEKGASKLAGEVDDVASTGKLSNPRALTEEHGEAARANKKRSPAPNHVVGVERDSTQTRRHDSKEHGHKGEALGEEDAARRIQNEFRRKWGMGTKECGSNGPSTNRDETEEEAGRFPREEEDTAWLAQKKTHLTFNNKRNQPKASGQERFSGSANKDDAGMDLAARSPSPSKRNQQPPSWMSPGKAAATAATAAAQQAAEVAAAAVRAAEAAADAAEAAEAAAELEEETQQSQSQSQGFPSPHANSGSHRPSPARSTFRLTDGGKEGSAKLHTDHSIDPKDRTPVPICRMDMEDGGFPTNGENPAKRVRYKGHVDEAHSARREESIGRGDSEEEEMLKRAREQARRHARDRRARALAKEQESKRELQAVQAELIKAEELREMQATAERAALEAKRARVMADMKRRQERLQRLQEEERLLSRRGGSHPSSLSSLADIADNEAERRQEAKREAGGDKSSREAGTVGGVGPFLSLPSLERGERGGGLKDAARGRRRPRHVSAFRERILEEKRARKEVNILKRKEIEERHNRQADYAAKIRSQAKRALAAEQRRAQDDADRKARTGGQSSVDRTPIAIKRPKRKGEWGVFSYAPDRPPGGAAPRKGQGRNLVGHPVASGFGSMEKVHGRLGTSELVDRMRKERARATEARRAQAAAAAATIGGIAGGGDGTRNDSSVQDDTGYRASEPNETAYNSQELGGDGGDGGRGGQEVGVRPRPPSPRAQQYGGVAARGGRSSTNDRGRGRGGGAGGGETSNAARHRGAPNRPPQHQHSPAVVGPGENILAMYEARLAALEQRLARGGGGKRIANRDSNASRTSPDAVSIDGQGQEGEWAENTPWVYRKLSSEDEGSCSISLPRGGGGSSAVVRKSSYSSGGEDVEGLSAMYMGPIAHKMAELRTGNG